MNATLFGYQEYILPNVFCKVNGDNTIITKEYGIIFTATFKKI